jgi:hypothetical protein
MGMSLKSLIPPPPNPGQPLSAHWGRRVIEALNALIPQAGPGVLIQQSTTGTTFSARSQPHNSPTTMPRPREFLSPFLRQPYVAGISDGVVGGHLVIGKYVEFPEGHSGTIELGVQMPEGWKAADGLRPERWEIALDGNWENLPRLAASCILGHINEGNVQTLNTHNKVLLAVRFVGQEPAEETWLYSHTEVYIGAPVKTKITELDIESRVGEVELNIPITLDAFHSYAEDLYHYGDAAGTWEGTTSGGGYGLIQYDWVEGSQTYLSSRYGETDGSAQGTWEGFIRGNIYGHLYTYPITGKGTLTLPSPDLYIGEQDIESYLPYAVLETRTKTGASFIFQLVNG